MVEEVERGHELMIGLVVWSLAPPVYIFVQKTENQVALAP